MKQIIISLLVLFAFGACSPHQYSTRSGGKENVSYVVVVTSGQDYKNVSVIVDEQSHPVEKVYKQKAIRKAHPIVITPGKHQIRVVADGKTLTDENIFIGLQETKKIILP